MWRRFAGDRAGSAPGNGYLIISARLLRLAGQLDRVQALPDSLARPTSAGQGRCFESVIEGVIEGAHLALALGSARKARDETDAELEALHQVAGSRHLPHFRSGLLLARGQAAQALGDLVTAGADFDEALALHRPLGTRLVDGNAVRTRGWCGTPSALPARARSGEPPGCGAGSTQPRPSG